MEELLRDLAPQVLGVVLRRYRDFDAAEDAVQEALLEAAVKWPEQGRPDNPVGWLVTVAGRRLTDGWRRDSARRRREVTAARTDVPADATVLDDSLDLLFLCCHPSLTPESQVALTLRAVGGLTTADIARAFLVPEPTMTRRISRAKRTLAEAGVSFGALSDDERHERLGAVLHALYLIFNEGYTAPTGGELADEAIRLTRQVHGQLPDDGEVAGLLALMLLTNARRPARLDGGGHLVPLAEQDRGRWDRPSIEEGTALITVTLPRSLVGPYQVQAAIAAVHAEAAKPDATDWPQILALYRLLARIAPSPVVTVNLAVALSMVDGPEAGLALLDGVELPAGGRHRVSAVRAHLLELAGDPSAARAAYELAARESTSLLEQRYLESRAGRLV